MGLFDEIGNKITGFGQESVKKTQNFTEVMKLNSEINEMEKEINTSYLEIGKIYYGRYAAESEDQEIIAYVRKITDSLERIDGLRAKIRRMKGIVKCKNCGADMEMNAIYCNRCGAKQIPDILMNGNGLRCPECGKEAAEGQTFCMNCGRRLDVREQPQEEKTEEVKERICLNCGMVLKEGASFCSNCGTKAEE